MEGFLGNNKFTSEQEFLDNYDSNSFEKLSVTTDILIFSVSDEDSSNYRKLGEKHFSILLSKRDEYPFKDTWCLPGGFVAIDETLRNAAKRILKRETMLDDIYIEQLYTFSNVNRDPRMRILSSAYLALLDKNRIANNLAEQAVWFNISVNKIGNKIDFSLKNGDENLCFSVLQDNNNEALSEDNLKVLECEKIGFDHALMIALGVLRLKNKIEYIDLVFHMMPESFTLGELQQVYEAILGEKLLKAAFRRMVADKVFKTEDIQVGFGHRPSAMFKYKN